MPHFGVHVVGKVQRGGAVGEVHHVALWGEHVHPVLGHLETELLGDVPGIAGLLVPVQHLPQPGDFFLVSAGGTIARIGALVTPVGADPQLRLLVHLAGADLYFQHLALGAHHGRVQGAVTVLLGIGDIVVKLIRDVVPQPVHQAQGGVAVGNSRHQDAYGADIVDLGKANTLALHLPPDAVDVLGPAIYLHRQPGVAQHRGQFILDPGDKLVAFHSFTIEQSGDLAVGVTVDVTKRQIFQLPLEMADTQAMGQWCVNVKYLTGDRQAALFVVLDGAYGAGALRQLDQCDPHIVHQRHQHFADIVLLILCLAQHWPVVTGAQFADCRHPGNAVNQALHRGTENLGHPRRPQPLLPHRAIENPRQQAVRAHLQLSQDQGYIEARQKAVCFHRPVPAVHAARDECVLGHVAGLQQSAGFNLAVIAGQPGQPLLEVDFAGGAKLELIAYLDHEATPSLAGEHTGGQVAVAAVADDRHNHGIFQLAGELQCGGDRTARGNAAKNTLGARQLAHGVLRFCLGNIDYPVHPGRIKNGGEVGLGPAPDAGDAGAFTGLQADDLDIRVLLLEVG